MVFPNADLFYAQGTFGTIILQEIVTELFSLRYFIFHLWENMALFVKEENEGLQSLLLLKGGLQFSCADLPMIPLSEGQFLLLNAGDSQTQSMVPFQKECHVLNAYYRPGFYADLAEAVPALRSSVAESRETPFLLEPVARPARLSVLHLVRELCFDTYQPVFQAYYFRLRIKQSLFTLLAQSSEKAEKPFTSPNNRMLAEKVRQIIEADLATHYTNAELAAQVNTSESSLKRAFQKEFGVGMAEYLRRLRMTKAHDMLLAGEQVKNAALTIGMRPSNFTQEFQNYFGYRATQVRNGK